MHRTLIKGGSVVTHGSARSAICAKGDVLIEDDRIAAVAPSIAGDDAEIIDASRHAGVAGPDQRPPAHLADGAARARRRLDRRRIHAGDASRPRHAVPARGHLHRQPDGRAQPDQQRRDHAGRLVSQQSDAGAHRCRDPRASTTSGIRALFLHGSPKPDPEARPEAFQRSADAARRGGAAAQGPLRKPRRADHLRSRDPGTVLFRPTMSRARTWQLAREFDLLASMHVGGGTPMVPDGFERLLDETIWSTARSRSCTATTSRPTPSRRIADRGGTFTVTAEIELQMGYGDPLTGILHALGRRFRSAPTSSRRSAAICSPACA